MMPGQDVTHPARQMGAVVGGRALGEEGARDRHRDADGAAGLC